MTELSNTELDNIDEVMNDIMEKKIFNHHFRSKICVFPMENKGFREKEDF